MHYFRAAVAADRCCQIPVLTSAVLENVCVAWIPKLGWSPPSSMMMIVANFWCCCQLETLQPDSAFPSITWHFFRDFVTKVWRKLRWGWLLLLHSVNGSTTYRSPWSGKQQQESCHFNFLDEEMKCHWLSCRIARWLRPKAAAAAFHSRQ